MNKLTRIVLALASVGILLGMIFLGQDLRVQENQTIVVTEQSAASVGEAAAVVKKAEKVALSDMHLRDNDALYANDDDTSVVTMYLTVSRGNAAEGTDHSWEEINTYSAYDYEKWGVPRYQVNGLLQVGDENGPLEGELGYGEVVPNATVQIRGQTSTKYAQRNYKIELKDGKGKWNDQRTIALNKHMADGMRFRNKLAYDLIEEIPQLMGLRTQFVHLYVRDMTGENPDEFVDYGLYTQVEQLNKMAMRAHGLDRNGHLYKINFFEFYRYEDVIRMESDPAFDRVSFEELLESKGDSDHSKLIRMLDAVNNVSIPASTLLDQYFDEENLTYWLAFQILIGNVDTQSRNVYLYSPLNSEKWYLIPWDHDGSLKRAEYKLQGRVDAGSWEQGVSNYWGNKLFQRCLKSESFCEKLDAAVEELYAFLNKDRLQGMAAFYAQVVKPYAFSMPDAEYIGVTSEQYDMLAENLWQEVENSYQMYKESWNKPMPFYIGVPVSDGNTLSFGWDHSYDFDAETITYTVELAKDYLFNETIFSQKDLLYPETSTELPEPGQYFVRVRATNTSGYTQDAFDYYVTDDGKNYGMLCFYVMEDGSVEVDIYEEG